MPVFYLCGDVYKFTRDHATLKFYKASHVLKTTKDYMKYSSKMAENRVLWNLQFSIEKQTEQTDKTVLSSINNGFWAAQRVSVSVQ